MTAAPLASVLLTGEPAAVAAVKDVLTSHASIRVGGATPDATPFDPGDVSLVLWAGAPIGPEALAWNRVCLAKERPLVAAFPLPDGALLGPLVRPERGACLACLGTQAALGAVPAPFDSLLRRSHVPFGDLSRGSSAAGARAADLLDPDSPLLRESLVWVDGNGRAGASCIVTRFATCPGCGDRLVSPAEVFYATQLFPPPEVRGSHDRP